MRCMYPYGPLSQYMVRATRGIYLQPKNRFGGVACQDEMSYLKILRGVPSLSYQIERPANKHQSLLSELQVLIFRDLGKVAQQLGIWMLCFWRVHETSTARQQPLTHASCGRPWDRMSRTRLVSRRTWQQEGMLKTVLAIGDTAQASLLLPCTCNSIFSISLEGRQPLRSQRSRVFCGTNLMGQACASLSQFPLNYKTATLNSKPKTLQLQIHGMLFRQWAEMQILWPALSQRLLTQLSQACLVTKMLIPGLLCKSDPSNS